MNKDYSGLISLISLMVLHKVSPYLLCLFSKNIILNIYRWKEDDLHHNRSIMTRKWRSQPDFPLPRSPMSFPPNLSVLTAITGHLQNVVFVRLAPAPVLSTYTSLKNILKTSWRQLFAVFAKLTLQPLSVQFACLSWALPGIELGTNKITRFLALL